MIYLLCYIGTIFGANWAITHFGIVPVGFGLMAPAGVYFVGLAFTFRDLAQNKLGPYWIMGGIVVGAGLSAILSPSLALASGVAFLCSEGADLAVYTPLREKHFLWAVGLSNTVGLVFDSVLFLWLAFHSLAFLPGQIVGKAWMTVLALLVLYPIRKKQAVVA
jgi:uncharacterized PurR-regulated membrane protein YhhQ (DUF165 family)